MVKYNVNKIERCSVCDEIMLYSDNVQGLAFDLGIGLHGLCYHIQKQNPDLPYKIRRSDLKGYWYCENKKHPTVRFDIIENKRRRRKINKSEID